MVDGTKIRQLREQEGFTLKELSGRAGISEMMMSYVERGLRTPTVDSLKHIADALGVSVDNLLKQERQGA